MAREGDEHLQNRSHGVEGFRETEDTGRLLALSDGVFAFAMTLLVINLTVPSALTLNAPPYAGLPTSVAITRYLASEWATFVSYVVAFMVIGLWWTIHRRVFRYIQGVDTLLNWTNLMFLLFIAVTPFVTGLDGVYGTTGIAVAIYSSVQCAAGITMAMIALHVSSTPWLAHPAADRLVLEESAQTSFMMAGIFAVSASLAQYSPADAQYAYYALIVVALWRHNRGTRAHMGRPRGPTTVSYAPSQGSS
ncbi:MAG: TMEM175 family protein [Thermoplasmata archaeon]